MAFYKQLDKFEVYFTPEQALRLRQVALQEKLEGDQKRGRHPRGNVSDVVRKAIEEYLDPTKPRAPSITPITQRWCWATFNTMLCLRKNFDMMDRENSADMMDILDKLMEKGDCWEIPAISREAERTGVRHKRFRLHIRGL